MATDHYGLTPSDWALPQAHDDPAHYAEARALGREQAEAIFADAEAKAKEERFREDVDNLTDLLSNGDTSGLPRGSSICREMNPMDPDANPRAVSVCIFPLPSMTIEEAIRSGLFPSGRFARHVYDQKVREAGLVGQWRRELW